MRRRIEGGKEGRGEKEMLEGRKESQERRRREGGKEGRGERKREGEDGREKGDM